MVREKEAKPRKRAYVVVSESVVGSVHSGELRILEEVIFGGKISVGPAS